jgi:NTE family protein
VRTIPIPTLGIGTTEFDISPEGSEALFQSGREAAEKFFARWEFSDYVEKYRKGHPPERTERLKKSNDS